MCKVIITWTLTTLVVLIFNHVPASEIMLFDRAEVSRETSGKDALSEGLRWGTGVKSAISLNT